MSAAQPSEPEPKRRVRWGLIVALVAGGLAFLCLAGVGLVSVLTAGQVKSARAAAEAYTAAVVAGDDGRALRYVCAAPSAEASHEEFTNYVREKGVRAGRVVNTNVTLWNFSWRATIRMDVMIANGDVEYLELPLAKESGEWRICLR